MIFSRLDKTLFDETVLFSTALMSTKGSLIDLRMGCNDQKNMYILFEPTSRPYLSGDNYIHFKLDTSIIENDSPLYAKIYWEKNAQSSGIGTFNTDYADQFISEVKSANDLVIKIIDNDRTYEAAFNIKRIDEIYNYTKKQCEL